ncbi:JAB1/MPN/MOV34 metalloenzyme domain-containing protein [Hirschfeldia incana]|nr:JAB1/MPN/MOV34 metalloenzyme domain-containing protein [Hirschfeldia incana]
MTIQVVVHPLVLRNIFHKHHWVVKKTGIRGVGVLLGRRDHGVVSVTNSYAVLFKEDPIWSFDETHHNSMLRMFAGINDDEDVVGWYSTCPEPHVNNLDMHAVFTKYAHDPLFLTIDVMRTESPTMEIPFITSEIPTVAYLAVNEVNEVGIRKNTFSPVVTQIAHPEEIGTSTRSTLVSEMPIAGDLPSMIEAYYLFVKNNVRISVEGYDLSLDPFELDRSLEEHFGSCGTVEYVDVPRHPDTNAISNRCTIVTLRGEFAEEKALALNGTDVDGWTVTVKVLPPTMTELMSGKSPRELALEYLARDC